MPAPTAINITDYSTANDAFKAAATKSCTEILEGPDGRAALSTQYSEWLRALRAEERKGAGTVDEKTVEKLKFLTDECERIAVEKLTSLQSQA